MEPERCAIRIIAENRKGVLRDIATIVADHEANIVMINQEVFDSGPCTGMAELYFEYDSDKGSDHDQLIEDLNNIPSVRNVKAYQPFGHIFWSRVIIIGGGAQVAQVALGAVNEADRVIDLRTLRPLDTATVLESLAKTNRLVVAEALVGRSFKLKRFHARARGRGAAVVKTWSNITVVVRERAGQEEKA